MIKGSQLGRTQAVEDQLLTPWRIELMCAASRFLFTVSLLWNICALAQQPTPLLPDPKLTPGDVFDVTLQDICAPGHSKKVRAATGKFKRQAYAEYGITSWEPGDYEVDHLIPLSPGFDDFAHQRASRLMARARGKGIRPREVS
jgi:hypothetical protein